MKVEGRSRGNRLEAQLALLSHPVMIWHFPQAPSLSFPKYFLSTRNALGDGETEVSETPSSLPPEAHGSQGELDNK